jgi:hypothetical protein
MHYVHELFHDIFNLVCAKRHSGQIRMFYQPAKIRVGIRLFVSGDVLSEQWLNSGGSIHLDIVSWKQCPIDYSC